MSDEHNWRRVRTDPLGRYYGTICAVCADPGGITYDRSMAELDAFERTWVESIIAARPKPPPVPRMARFRNWRNDRIYRTRCRLASIVAGFDV